MKNQKNMLGKMFKKQKTVLICEDQTNKENCSVNIQKINPKDKIDSSENGQRSHKDKGIKKDIDIKMPLKGKHKHQQQTVLDSLLLSKLKIDIGNTPIDRKISQLASKSYRTVRKDSIPLVQLSEMTLSISNRAKKPGEEPKLI